MKSCSGSASRYWSSRPGWVRCRGRYGSGGLDHTGLQPFEQVKTDTGPDTEPVIGKPSKSDTKPDIGKPATKLTTGKHKAKWLPKKQKKKRRRRKENKKNQIKENKRKSNSIKENQENTIKFKNRTKLNRIKGNHAKVRSERTHATRSEWVLWKGT